LVKYLSRTRDGQDEEKEILLSYTILQDVYKNKKCLITADAFQDPVLGKAASIAANQFRAAMCVPLIAHNKVHGVLHLDSPVIHAFTTKDMALCRAIGNQTAIAIENANLLSDIENEVRIRETLGRFLPPHVISKSVEKGSEGDLIKKGGRNIIGTILFADIRDFTTFSEENSKFV
jgi:adenylate cyclase